METVGVRELKNRLSAFLRRVRAGEGVLVTDRGEVIAEISPPGARLSAPALPPGLVALARAGVMTLASRNRPDLYQPAPPRRQKGHGAAQLLDEERGAR